MDILTVIVVLILLALILPIAGVNLNAQVMSWIPIILVIALLVWLLSGRSVGIC